MRFTFVLLSLFLVGCSSSTTTTPVAGDAGPSQDQDPTLVLPSGCAVQSAKLTSESCDDNEILVACPRGTAAPPKCKQSVYPDSFCCAVTPVPPPGPPVDPAIGAFCKRHAACPGASADAAARCQASLSSATNDCAAERSAVVSCLGGASTDACDPVGACSKQMAAFFACHAKKDGATCTYAPTATDCSDSSASWKGRMELVCDIGGVAWNACGAGKTVVNGEETSFICCDPKWFMQD